MRINRLDRFTAVSFIATRYILPEAGQASKNLKPPGKHLSKIDTPSLSSVTGAIPPSGDLYFRDMSAIQILINNFLQYSVQQM
jgi:hypothetical protein